MDLSQYKLIWSDEFNYFDSSKWIKGSSQTWPDRYGTIKAWDPSLVSVGNGYLHLAVDQRSDGWYGGLVQGRNLEAWKYGYVEVRAELPAGQGLWSALWMMPRDNVYGYWPNSGEIDILEYLGTSRELTHGYSTVHYATNGNHAQKYVAANGTDWSQGWHTWGMEWDKGSDGHVSFTFYVDGKAFGTISDTEYARAAGGGQGSPFDQFFYPILNLTVGGAWAGEPTSAVDGAELLVDWVRVYQEVQGSTGTGSTGTGSSGTGSSGTNSIVGSAGRDAVKGTAASEQISGLGGDDTIEAGGGNDTIFAGPGNDFIFGGAGADLFMIEPGQGPDKVLDYVDGTDKIGLSAGLRFEDLRFSYDSTWKYTWVTDKAGNNLMGLKYVLPTKMDASDFVTAGSSSGSTTTVSGTGGTAAGSSSSGTTSASTGFVRINGTNAAETRAGTAGNDLIQGLGGSDTIYAGAGNDTISGGAGNDFVFGGAGVDVVRFEPGQGSDRFSDFQDGIDRIGLTGGVQFADLYFLHDPTWGYTWIGDASGARVLGLKNILPWQVTALDFTTLDASLF